MEENHIGFVKDDLHVQRRQAAEGICANAWKDSKPNAPHIEKVIEHEDNKKVRASSIVPRSHTKSRCRLLKDNATKPK